jgi:hypothetical protein
VVALGAAIACGGDGGLRPHLQDRGSRLWADTMKTLLWCFVWCRAGRYGTGRHQAELATDGGALAVGQDLGPFGPD